MNADHFPIFMVLDPQYRIPGTQILRGTVFNEPGRVMAEIMLIIHM